MTKCKALTGSAVKGLSRFVTNRDKSRWLSSCRIKFDGGSTRRRQAKSIRIDFRCPSGLLMRVDCQVYSSQGRRHDVFLGGGRVCSCTRTPVGLLFRFPSSFLLMMFPLIACKSLCRKHIFATKSLGNARVAANFVIFLYNFDSSIQ